MNLPNKLTVLRVIMIPFFLFFYFANFIPYHYLAAFVIFVVASLTDTLDGYLARKHNLVTSFGKLMDPLADKLLVTAAMVCILSAGYVTNLHVILNFSPEFCYLLGIIALIIMLSRDLIVNAIRQVAATEGVVIAADIFGKVKTVLQMVWLSLALLTKQFFIWGYDKGMFRHVYSSHMPSGFEETVSIIEGALFFAMLLMTVFSGLNYVIKNKSIFADA